MGDLWVNAGKSGVLLIRDSRLIADGWNNKKTRRLQIYSSKHGIVARESVFYARSVKTLWTPRDYPDVSCDSINNLQILMQDLALEKAGKIPTYWAKVFKKARYEEANTP